MKKFINFALACVAAFALAACTTTSTPSPSGVPAAPPTPAQIAAQVCPPVQTAMAGINALVGLPASAQKDLQVITPIVAAVCAVGSNVNSTNLQDLAQTALPAIINVVKTSALSAEEQNAIVVDVTAARLILTAITQAQVNMSSQPSATPATTK